MGEVTDTAPVLDALTAIDRAVRDLYAARPTLAEHPQFVADMLRDVAVHQASASIKFENLMRQVEQMRAKIERANAQPGPRHVGTIGEADAPTEAGGEGKGGGHG